MVCAFSYIFVVMKSCKVHSMFSSGVQFELCVCLAPMKSLLLLEMESMFPLLALRYNRHIRPLGLFFKLRNYSFTPVFA